MSKVKVVVFVPEANADEVRAAMSNAGAGVLGNYENCSFSIKGTGRFRGNEKSNPRVGKAGVLESVPEERIEVTVDRARLAEVVRNIRKVHPYEEVPIDVYALEEI